MSDLGLPFRGKAWYSIQSAYGTEPTDGDTGLPISCKIQDVRIGIGDKHKELIGIDAPNVSCLLEQCSDFSLHLEYIPQSDDALLATICNRTAEFKLQSLGFVVLTNHNLTNVNDRSSYKIWGCKPKTIRVSASINNEYLITADFSIKDYKSRHTDGELNCPSEPSALTGDYLAFNIAGSIQKGAGDVAYILESIDLTIDQGLTDKYDHDSLVKQYAIEGKISFSGSVDISLDEGGRDHALEILSQTEFDLTITMGAAGSPVILIKHCKWKSGEIDINTSGDILADSAPFTGKPTDGDLTSIVT
jgi:hypothetical protein